MKKKRGFKKTENFIFLAAIVVIFLFGLLTLIRTEKTISKTENRTLTTFSHFTIKSFIDGSFQDNFESALSDQFIGSEKIRVLYAKLIGNIPSFSLGESVCQNHYLELVNSVDRRRGTFNCEDYIVYYPEPLTDEQTDIVANNLQIYNHINKLTDAYYYFVNDSSVYNFETNQKVVDYDAILKQNLTGNYHLASLNFDNYAAYKPYFYKTDHHWNNFGSYQGYLAIHKLLNLSDQPLEPTSEQSNHEAFFGSHARNTNNYDYQEEFNYYTFNLPPHSTVINGLPATYGHYSDYINHNYVSEDVENTYAFFYGSDEGEIIYDFRQSQKDNLLIISNSYSNAVNELIASHYNKTFIIDLRRYKTIFGQDFKLEEYLEKNHINKTLLLISPTFIRDTSTHQGLEP
jgi:hypothetical protein